MNFCTLHAPQNIDTYRGNIIVSALNLRSATDALNSRYFSVKDVQCYVNHTCYLSP